MKNFQLFCILNYRLLRILTIIVVSLLVINIIEAEKIGVSDAFETITHTNQTVLTTKSNDYEINEKLESNSSQWSVSRPSNILKRLWSSASESINSTNNNNILKLSDFNENNTNSLKNFKFGPIKWSTEIVPSVPLELQIPKDAIFSQHFLIKSNSSKSSPDGEITVINGIISSPVLYSQQQYQNLNKNYLPILSKIENLQIADSSVTPNISDIFLTINEKNGTESLISPEPLVSKASHDNESNDFYFTPAFENSKNDLSSDKTSITTRNESNVYRKALLDSEIQNTTPSEISNITPVLYSPEVRRQALKSKFGMRATSPPLRVSTENVMSVYKPSNTKYNVWNKKLSSKASNNSFSIKPQKIYSANSISTINNRLNTAKEKLIINSSEKTITSSVKPKEKIPIALQNQNMPLENRNMLSSMLLFPSRPTPTLKPRISNPQNDSTPKKLSENLFKKLINSKRNNFLNNFNNTSNNNNNNSIFLNEKRNNNQMKNSEINKLFKNLNNRRVDFLTHSDKKDLMNNYSEKVYNYSNRREFSPYFDWNNEEIYDSEYSLPGPPYALKASDDISLSLPQQSLLFEDKDNVEQTHISPEETKIKNRYKKYEDKYKIIPNPELFKPKEDKPKAPPKFTIRPIDPHYFQKLKSHKNPATLPNKMQAFQELVSALSAIKKSIKKLNPIGKHISKKYKILASKVRSDIMSNKGAYANYYPPGVYDKEYEPVEVEEGDRRLDDTSASEINETIIELPDNYTYIDGIEDLNNNNSFTQNEYDDEGFIKKSFGYKVTIYRSPENGETNVTEEVMNDNNTKDQTSESSNEIPVTTTDISSNNKREPVLDVPQNDVSRAEKHGELKGRGKIVDYERKKFSKETGTHAREAKNANKLKKIDSHDRRANNERALKERTIIEFFEKEHILDAAFNRDKLGIDKGKHYHNDGKSGDQYASGTNDNNPTTISYPEGSITESPNEPEAYDSINNEQKHVTDSKTFDTTFPEHDRKYKHKNNAHKYKGWRERGYKIVTETEFVDRGLKFDTGYKKHEKGNSEHIKEHSAKGSGRGDKRKYYKNTKQVNKNYESQYGNQQQKNYDKEVNPNQYPLYNNEPSVKSEDNKQEEEQQTHDNEQSKEQTSGGKLPQSYINNSFTPYGSRLSPHNPTNLWHFKPTAAHLTGHDLYTNNNHNNYDSENHEDINHYDQKEVDHKINDVKSVQNVEPDSYTNINPYPQVETNPNFEEPISPYYYPLPDQEYYPHLDSNYQNQNNNQTEGNYYSMDENYKNQENNDPINYSNIETNSNRPEYPPNPPYYSSYYYPNATYGRKPINDYREQQMAPIYKSTIEINPTKEPQMTTNPYYEYQIYPNIDNNNYGFDHKENYRPYNYRLETMPAISTKGKSQHNSNLSPNFPDNAIDNTFANEVIHIQEAPDLSLDNYRKQTPNLKSIDTTESVIPTKQYNKFRLNLPKVELKSTKNKSRKERPKSNFDKLAQNYHLIPASPLLPPFIQSLYLNANPFTQLQTPYLSQSIQYQIKVPFPLQTQSPTRLPLLMQTSTTPIITTDGLQLDPSDGQPVAVLHPNKMLTITTPALLKRKPLFAGHMWTNLNTNRQLSPLRWIINNYNTNNNVDKQLFRVKTNLMPTPMSYNLITPMINPKISHENGFRNRFLLRNLFKLRKRY